jgi:hypothetical protein
MSPLQVYVNLVESVSEEVNVPNVTDAEPASTSR